MALVGNDLGDAIKAAVDGVGDHTDRVALYRAVGTAIVNYIKANATVSSNVVVTSVSGVTTGPSASGPGSGTATGTIA